MSLPKWVESKRTFFSGNEERLCQALSIALEALEDCRQEPPPCLLCKEAMRRIEELGK